MIPTSPLFQPLILSNGAVIPNRLAKAAMEENLATYDHAPSPALLRLYRAWAEGGVGLILSGNVMIDARAMTGPGGVVLESRQQFQLFREWARVGRSGGAQFWLQLNHPGRQVRAALGQRALAPAAVPLSLGRYSKMFDMPVAMTPAEIQEVINRFAIASVIAEEAGFSGVQIHAAHGYLLSQFLSPLTNHRDDNWGGSLESRARLLNEVVRAIRSRVSQGFCVSVKINSADFQRGGFQPEEAREVIAMLNGQSVQLVELSGGSYEAPAMQGDARDGRTLAREAYFLDFARDARAVAQMPLMLTGGIKRRSIAEKVIESGIEIAGMATALALRPSLPNEWRTSPDITASLPPIHFKSKPLASLAYMSLVKYQLRRLSEARRPHPNASPLLVLLREQVTMKILTRRYRSWMRARASD